MTFSKTLINIGHFLNDPLQTTTEHTEELKEIWAGLSELSGFPEPYLAGRKTTYRRWSNIYSKQLIREDIRDLTGVKSVMDMETLYLLLPSKVGSSVSVPSLARDLKVAYNSRPVFKCPRCQSPMLILGFRQSVWESG